jgi:hypothetical protein
MVMSMKNASTVFTLSAALLCGTGLSQADEPWTVRTTAYGWLPSISGSSTIRRFEIDIDADFSDVASEMDSLVALMAYTEARHDRWGFYLDVIWMDVGFTAESARETTTNPGVGFGAEAELGTQIGFAEFGGAYEVAKWGEGTSSTAIDGLFGLRGNYVGLDLALDVVGAVNLPELGLELDGTRAVARSGDLWWLDPIVGARYRHTFSGGDRLQIRGDVGGFGLGSDLTWQVVGTYSHDFNDGAMSAVIGYRAMGIDYERGSGPASTGIDLVLHGPLIGLTFRW